MFSIRFLCVLLVCLCLLGMPVAAAQVECDAVYCFTSADFSTGEEPIAGICITGLPDPASGTILLGSRVLRRGDILAAEDLQRMTFQPLRTQQDASACISYLPIYQNRVAPCATMEISVLGKEDLPPVATDSAIETYKNLPNEGTLSAEDPEGQSLTYTVVRAPKRGAVELQPDGRFTYTPKKNKVGVDSFTFTAADPAGNVSREATVTIQILKPAEAVPYADTANTDCRFEAEWLRNTGLFAGERVNDQACFYPEKAVSRGEFLAMVVKALDIPVQEVSHTGIPEDAPQWMKPYLAAALRSGLTAGWPDADAGAFDPTAPVTGAEAAVMLQNALDLSAGQEWDAPQEDAQIPVWAASSLAVMAENGVALTADQPLTRADAALVLYRISHLAETAPGMAVFRMQQ